MKIQYANVILPSPNVLGGSARALGSRSGYTLTRIIEDGRDDLVVVGKGREMHISWSQVKGGIVATPGVGGGDFAARLEAKKAVETGDTEDEGDVGEPTNDVVRVTRKRGKAAG